VSENKWWKKDFEMTEGQNNCSAKGKCRFFIGVPTVKGKKKVSFCEVGYTQNPKTEVATRKAMQAGAEICRFNQHRKVISGR